MCGVEINEGSPRLCLAVTAARSGFQPCGSSEAFQVQYTTSLCFISLRISLLDLLCSVVTFSDPLLYGPPCCPADEQCKCGAGLLQMLTSVAALTQRECASPYKMSTRLFDANESWHNIACSPPDLACNVIAFLLGKTSDRFQLSELREETMQY